MPLNPERARQAIYDHVAVPLGLDLYEAAAGIVQIVNNNMVGALRVVSVEKGYDPERFALVAFGGAGPLHAGPLAQLLGTPTVQGVGDIDAEAVVAATVGGDLDAVDPDRGVVVGEQGPHPLQGGGVGLGEVDVAAPDPVAGAARRVSPQGRRLRVVHDDHVPFALQVLSVHRVVGLEHLPLRLGDLLVASLE